MPILNNLCFLWWILITSGVFCYNVDTNFSILYQNGGSEDYFGFSVGLISNSRGYRALITAPRANSSSRRSNVRNLHQPGTLFNCEISPSKDDQDCNEVEVDPEGNVEHENRRNPDLSYLNKRDDMWLGVSLDTQPIPSDNNVVVCGHLWKNEVPRSGYYVSGACYVLNSNLNTNTVNKIIPFVDTSQNGGRREFYYQQAQAGASAAFSEDGLSLLLGCPGYRSWKGNFVSYDLNIGTKTQKLNDPIIPEIRSVQRSSSAYLGYSITSGRFFDDGNTYTAVGAPRDNAYTGRVFVFRPLEGHAVRINNPFQTIAGMQAGEYFGASVSGIDLTGDGLTDLLVGAPFYSEESGGDEGKVHVYIGTRQKALLSNGYLNGENKPNARFGTCIGNTGDLNQDGYNDVAIGAPYEDDNGVVYIYHGRTNGIHPIHAQRISAKDIKSPIAGFGISISRGLDIDNNSYPDILIGSYASSNAVLLRTRPVIRVEASISFGAQKIDMNLTACDSHGIGETFPCISVKYCLSYSGRYVLPSLEFQTVLIADTDRRMSAENARGFFLSAAQPEPQTSISRTVRIQEGKKTNCFQETAYIHKNTSDEITPVKFLLRYELDRNATVSCRGAGFLKDCPVIDPASPPTAANSIGFQTDCEDVCRADLSVEANVAGTLKNETLIVGQSNLTLNAIVRNSGEPAYSTELSITLPPETSLLKYDKCEKARKDEEHNNPTLKCRFRNALKKDQAVNIQIVIDARDIPVGNSTLEVHFVARTISEDIDKSNNEVKLRINCETAADFNIAGKPENPEIPQTKDKGAVLITHNYHVTYYGPSPVDKIDINLYIPSSIEGRNGIVTFLAQEEFVSESSEISTKCNSSVAKTGFEHNDENNSSIPNFETPEVIRSAADSNRRSKRSPEETATDAKSEKGENYALDCETVECDVIHCEAGPFRNPQKHMKFMLTFRVNFDVLSSIMGPWNKVTFITKGEISMGGLKMLSSIYRNETTVETAIVRLQPPAPQEAPKWIIYASIGGGLLLLLIILVVLLKTGFFKRKRLERMKTMRSQVHAREMQQMPPVDEREVADDNDLCPNDKS